MAVFFLFVPPKGGNGGGAAFSYGVGAGKIWGCKGFLPEFSETCPKSFRATYAYKFSPPKIIKTFFV